MPKSLPKFLTAAVMTVFLSGCGSVNPPSSHFERAVASAGLGMMVAYPIGLPVMGAIAFGGVASFTDQDDINIGEPVWRWNAWD